MFHFSLEKGATPTCSRRGRQPSGEGVEGVEGPRDDLSNLPEAMIGRWDVMIRQNTQDSPRRGPIVLSSSPFCTSALSLKLEHRFRR